MRIANYKGYMVLIASRDAMIMENQIVEVDGNKYKVTGFVFAQSSAEAWYTVTVWHPAT